MKLTDFCGKLRAPAMLLLLVLVIPDSQGAAQPQKTVAVPMQLLGLPLRTALPTLGREFGVELGCSKELAEQRVTLIGRRRNAAAWKKDLQDLLSPEKQAGVFWTKSGNAAGSILRESKNRRELALRLRDTDQVIFRTFVATEYAWANEHGWSALETEQSPGARRALIARLGKLMQLNAFGEEGRERLFAGEPVVVPFSRLLGPRQEAFFREWLKDYNPTLVELPADQLGQYQFVFLRERHPTDPRAGGFTRFLVKPSGFVPNHGSILRMPHRATRERYLNGFRIPISDDKEQGKRVTFCLTPEPNAKPGAFVERTLDELLKVVAGATGVTIVADGYLRPTVRIPANLVIKDCTIEAVLRSLAEAWECDWKLSEAGDAVLLRAKFWWLEDAANVPPEQVAEFRATLGSGKPPGLADLLRLAELEEPQVRKLMDLGLCKSANGILPSGLHDGVGAKPVLQFYNRLPRALQDRAQSPTGLPLRAVDPALVARLNRVLITAVGATTPERRNELTLFLRVLPPYTGQTEPSGWEVVIRGAKRGGSHFFRSIRPVLQIGAAQ